ncbi:MAG: ABC transporter permease [Candidatus Nitrosocaldus sp.]|nr:ABC transporter permease [Candidatus Nitrosocaldus sp.]MDW7999847.1 ABC transporter permease [Candidatus Nitrosocaldus sp.]
MGFGRFLVKRAVNMFIVLFFTIFITIALLGPSMDNILRLAVEHEVRQEIINNRALVSGMSTQELERYTREQIESRMRAIGLDEPWYSPKRLWFTMLKILTFDLGRAYFLIGESGSSRVADIIMERLPRTVLLFTTATAIVAAIGVLVGAFAARRHGMLVDRINAAFAVVSSSFPLWWTGMLMIFVFAFMLNIFPARATPVVPASDPSYPIALLYHMLLPLLTMILMGFGSWSYIVRNLLIGILGEDFIMAKRAMGIPERRIVYAHAVKNAAPPIITIVSLSLSSSIGGAIISEAVFDWPGIGKLYFDAISVLDLPVIVGLTYITTLVFLISIFIADILYGYFDPRVKVG